MATKKRECSESGFYHVYQRGVCLFDIFEDDADREFFLKRMTRYFDELGVEIHAWCLMSNHVHLLLKADLEELSAAMRKLESVYVRRFNRRHMRSGPLFEGRFCSVCVKTDEQYMNTMRYIHRNPVRHEAATLCGSYKWTSYGEHVAASPDTCVVKLAMSLFESVENFIRMHGESDVDRERYLDVGTSGPMRDDEARAKADAALKLHGFRVGVTRIGTLPQAVRDRAIACVKRSVGCSLRQLQRLTAIAYSVIRKASGFAAGNMTGVSEDERYESPMQELSASLESPLAGRASNHTQERKSVAIAIGAT